MLYRNQQWLTRTNICKTCLESLLPWIGQLIVTLVQHLIRYTGVSTSGEQQKDVFLFSVGPSPLLKIDASKPPGDTHPAGCHEQGWIPGLHSFPSSVVAGSVVVSVWT